MNATSKAKMAADVTTVGEYAGMLLVHNALWFPTAATMARGEGGGLKCAFCLDSIKRTP